MCLAGDYCDGYNSYPSSGMLLLSYTETLDNIGRYLYLTTLKTLLRMALQKC